MLEQLKREVCRANLALVERGLVIETFGNVSGIERSRDLVVIKPSGVSYKNMRPEHMVVVSLEGGKVVEGRLQPSSDADTHLILYRGFPKISSVVHTHSLHATAWAQAKRELPIFGTTQADYWRGAVPCTRSLTAREVKRDYEANTGRVIVERFKKLDPEQFPGVLVASHGPFTWGKDPADAVHNAFMLEFVARLASETLRLNPKVGSIDSVLRDKHFLRKHGAGAYYGQK